MPCITKFAAPFLGLAAASSASAAESGVSSRASVLVDFGHGWTLTNSMVTGWAVTLALILVIIFTIRRPKIFPTRGQAVFESVLEALRDLFEPIVGARAFPAAFPILVCFFIFILIQNWMGLIPGVGTVGWGSYEGGHFEVHRSLIRPFTADLNGTVALAAVSFGAWLIIVLKYTGPKAIITDLFGNKADRSETPLPLYLLLSVIFLLVGVIEVFSILIRPFTLSVRLFGNILGGESLLHGTGFLFVFYFMELLVGLVQSVVFTLLTAVYIGLLCNHGDDHGDGDHASTGAAAAHH